MDNNKNDEHNQYLDEKTGKEYFYVNGNYYTREEFFNPNDEDKPDPKRNFKWIKITIMFLVTVALIGNVLALWPRIYNFASVHFLKTSQELSKNEDVQLYKESVVVVQAGNSRGTGFLFSEDGYIMTNDHVVNDEAMITVTFHDGITYSTEVVEANSKIDIAILKIAAEDLNYPVLEFEDTWIPNQPIYVIGNPIHYNFIVNKGKILGLTPGRETPMLMIDAPIYKGNSGSPVIGLDGKVIGVVFATSTLNDNGEPKKVGLAIPINYIKEIMGYQ